MLEKSIGKTIKRDAFELVQKFALISQLKHHRARQPFGMSFRTSNDNSIMFNDAFSRKSQGDNLSNILRPGLIKTDKSFVDASAGGVPNVTSKPSGHTSFMTPASNTSRTYDSHMVNYGFQMGFGAVPSRVQIAQE